MRLVKGPILCNYYLTYRCNARCGFCDIWEKPSPYANLDTVKKNLLDLKNHFNGNYLIIDEAKVKVGGKDFTQNEGNFFFLRYDYNGETINKKLSSSGDSLILNSSEIFKIDNKAIDGSKITSAKLYYRRGSKSQFINQFAPQFVKGDDLAPEVQIILEELKDKEKKEKTEEVTSYLIENYAKPGRDNLNWFLENNFKI